MSNNKKIIKKQLHEHYEILKNSHLSDLFSNDKNRGKHFTSKFHNLFIDYSKNHITDETLELLLNYAKELDIKKSINAMFSGKEINVTEGRAVLHHALRPKPEKVLELKDN